MKERKENGERRWGGEDEKRKNGRGHRIVERERKDSWLKKQESFMPRRATRDELNEIKRENERERILKRS